MDANTAWVLIVTIVSVAWLLGRLINRWTA
jgi:hypothetical protein